MNLENILQIRLEFYYVSILQFQILALSYLYKYGFLWLHFHKENSIELRI